LRKYMFFIFFMASYLSYDYWLRVHEPSPSVVAVGVGAKAKAKAEAEAELERECKSSLVGHGMDSLGKVKLLAERELFSYSARGGLIQYWNPKSGSEVVPVSGVCVVRYDGQGIITMIYFERRR